MDVRTGELFSALSGEELEKEKKKRKGFLRPVPKEHEEEARKILDGKKRGQADMKKKTPLVRWAKQQCAAINKKNQRKVRRKIADASRKRNRAK